MKNQTVQGTQLMLSLNSIIERGIKLATKIMLDDEEESSDESSDSESESDEAEWVFSLEEVEESEPDTPRGRHALEHEVEHEGSTGGLSPHRRCRHERRP